MTNTNFDPYTRFGLKKVINADGKMTILGASTLSDAVVAGEKLGAQRFFEIAALSQATGQYIAQLTGAEAGIIVNSASAGIVQSVAALIGQGSMHHVFHPFEPTLSRREIVLPLGQDINYGAPESLMIEMAGGQVVHAGYANECTPAQVDMMITEQTAAVLFVKSHHAVQKSMLTASEAIAAAHARHVPIIIDAAAEEDLHEYITAGADLVIYSGTKAFSGPTSGFVVGRQQYIDWVRMQGQGIGRAMKIGKENILGLVAALDEYTTVPPKSGDTMKQQLTPLISQLNAIHGITANIVQDSAGRDIFRASLKVDPQVIAPEKLADALRDGNPAIYVRAYRVNEGILEIDPRALTEEELQQIVDQIQTIITKEKN
ncbi:DgaE family pyridoxal phosphate-dependent ammonia lyase [Schleiferilactobacillus perolens]|uniref:L-seryl-tRNA(Sec) selenium transferase n=1 Tax=Schleiferilactobacillus perolens DSM 12744 TaxID=1423792 RepID=A0A0R1N3I4_9LACO|nr:DgaE family pyridoxal phosphate-dependent ammonia lyase [Schleiferilactobacillus perolens]KRL11315.1 L-seryl-tRNA(Sec) selenium transferase [Schleiferilactobacillus perolens DSM 12744]